MNRQGFYRTIGQGERAFRSFVPTRLQDIHLEVDDEMQQLLKEAYGRICNRNIDSDVALLAEVKASVSLVYGEENPISFAFMGGDDPEKQKRIFDETSLKRAIEFAAEHMEQLPISSRLLKDVHWVMMQGEHNEKKYPGEIRTSPIWLGTKEDTLTTAPFVPPVYEDMDLAITDLEKYIHYEEQTDPLIMAALIHYQFEVIHPFIDGNGRMGRLLTMLFLQERGSIQQSALRLSENLLKNSFRYFTGIASVEVSGTYEKWVKFFLKQL